MDQLDPDRGQGHKTDGARIIEESEDLLVYLITLLIKSIQSNADSSLDLLCQKRKVIAVSGLNNTCT